jgi:hypothetical protein
VTRPAAPTLAPVTTTWSQQSKRGQRLASPSVLPFVLGEQLPEHALDPAPGCVLYSCRPAAEHLDAMVVGVRDVDFSTGINRDTEGAVELPGLRAIAAPRGAVGGRQFAPCRGREQSPDDDEWNHDALSHGDLLVELGTPNDRVRCGWLGP